MLNIGELALGAATRLSASDSSREYTLEIKTVKRKKEKIFRWQTRHQTLKTGYEAKSN